MLIVHTLDLIIERRLLCSLMQATKDDGFKQRKLFLEERQRITRLRMEVCYARLPCSY